MEAISDFFRELKSRASNPLISSFLMAWLICNWQIVVALVFYKTADLKYDGYTSFNQLIKANYSNQHMLVIPGIISLVYTFAFPYLKATVKLYNARIETKNETDILKASQNGQMPIMKYIELKQETLQVIEKFNALIDAEGQIRLENTNLKADMLTMQQMHQSEISMIQEKLNISDEKLQDLLFYIKNLENDTTNSLQGSWEVQLETSDNEIQVRKWHILGTDINEDTGKSYHIKFILTDPFTRRLACVIQDDSYEDGELLTFCLESHDDFCRIQSLFPINGSKVIFIKKLQW